MGDRWDVRTGPPDAAYSRVTRDLAAVTALVASSTFEGGTRVGVVAGRTVAETVPTRFCAACDETGEDMVEMVERIVQTVTGGFREYHRRDGGTWFTGHEAVGIGGSARGETYGPHAEPWVVDWQAWPLR